MTPVFTAGEPKRGTGPQQDVTWEPNATASTIKGASGNPGSAVKRGQSDGGSGATNEATGFVGTREFPDQDEF